MSYLGFDRSAFPGSAQLAYLKLEMGFSWCGFYLAPAPSHGDPSWMNADRMLFANIGRAPIYVGRQVTGPGARLYAGAQGDGDGAHAAALTLLADFPSGSRIYLDVENGPPLTDVQTAYIVRWAAAVRANGFKPGVYCSFELGAEIHHLVPDAVVWVFHVRTTTPHAVVSPVQGREPANSGYDSAEIWQFDDEAILRLPADLGGSLVVDLNCSTVADPSKL